MKKLIALSVLLFLGSPVLGQGPSMGGADCPLVKGPKIGSQWQYQVIDCAHPNGPVVFVLSSQDVNCPVPCENGICTAPLTGSGPDAKKPAQRTEPVKELNSGEPFRTWLDFLQATTRTGSCGAVIDAAGIKQLGESQLVASKDKNEAFQELVKTAPQVVERYLAARTYQEQQVIVRDFNRQLTGLLAVSINGNDAAVTPFRTYDLPVQRRFVEELEINVPEKQEGNIFSRDASETKVEDAGFVKVVDGDQTFFFKLTVANYSSKDGRFPVAVLRSGLQVPSASGDVKVGKFVGQNRWAHKVEVDGKMFLVTSKDRRKSSE